MEQRGVGPDVSLHLELVVTHKSLPPRVKDVDQESRLVKLDNVVLNTVTGIF